jgi:hypothetical protein
VNLSNTGGQGDMRRLIGACFLLTTVLVASEGAVLGAFRLRSHDLFAPYQALMPAQSIDGLSSYPCLPRASEGNGRRLMVCRFDQENSFFSDVLVSVSSQRITRTVFSIHGDRLRLGDLILCWGKPSVVALIVQPNGPPWVEVQWGANIYATLAHDDRSPNMYHPVIALSMSAPPPRCGSRQ